jgi:Tol biopolymer transport system component
MSSDRWREVSRLYHAAMAQPPDARVAFLTEACPDDTVRQEVEALLAQPQSAPGFLEPGAFGEAVLALGDVAALTGSIGPYEIQGLLGVGGMGEVYRARDPRLGRDVAIKILPREFTNDINALTRFEREARILAALNHPNIGAIYGLEDGPAGDDGPSRALILEFVDGVTLAERLVRPIPISETLTIARQIADALEAAHEQGIIHRDLKPTNVKVRPDGTVKVLDFGLAKALTTAPASGSPDSPNAPTSPAVATQCGVVLGTAAYMSPEQAKGRAVDTRADIWAFGAVLYEMLTGRPAFSGDTVSDTLVAVVASTPAFDALPGGTPPRLEHLLRRCLDRDARMRLRDIGEARVELIRLEAGGFDQPATSLRVAAPKRWAWMAAALAGVAVAGTLAVYAPVDPAPSPRPSARAQFELSMPAGAVLTGSGAGLVGISPDGRYIVFAARTDGKRALWLRPIDSQDARLLAGTDGGTMPFWSPDSAFIGFFANDGLKRLEISTGSVQPLTEASATPGGGAWNRDGVIVFAPIQEGPLFRVAASGGTATPLTTLDAANQESMHSWPSFLPDGRHYLFQVFGTANSGIYLGALGSAERTLLIRQESVDATAVQYASGHLVFVRNRTLVAQPFDADALELRGEAFPLAQGFGIGGTGSPAFGVSENGVLVFRRFGEPATFQLTWLGRDGVKQGTVGAPAAYRTFDLSPDGQTLAVDRFVDQSVSIWLMDVARGTSTRFTSDPFSAGPIWSPQGDRIGFGSVRDTAPNPFVRTLAGVEQRLARVTGNVDIRSWSPDGRVAIGDITDARTRTDLWLFSTSGPQPPTPFLQTVFDERSAMISPDGRWVAFTSDEGGVPAIYVTTFPVPGPRVRISPEGGDFAWWRGDEKELFFQTGLTIMSARIMTAAGAANAMAFRTATPRALFTLPSGTGFWMPSDDGQRFLVSVPVTNARPGPIQVVLNWDAPGRGEINRRPR